MKKILLVVLMVLVLSGVSFGVGTTVLTSTTYDAGTGVQIITVTFTADASDGSIPTLALTGVEGYLVKVTTNPGSTGPTDNWDVTLLDSDGIDICGTAVTNRDITNSEQTFCLAQDAATPVPVYMSGTITVTPTGNSVNSATGTIKLFIQK